MLDVGAGQGLAQMKYFAAKGNDVVGVDRDLVAQGFDPAAFLQMLRTNGLLRVVKTLGRKALGIDARFDAELHRRLGTPARRGAALEVHQQDASHLSFPDADFDFVYSRTVVQHLEHPELAVNEIVRVLRPGGAAYVDFMPYTGPIGCLDIRMLSGRNTGLPPWAHLRPSYAGLVRESAYLNRLPLSAWRELLQRSMPGCVIMLDQPDRELRTAQVKQARVQGDLLDYDLEELLTYTVVVVWRKPLILNPTNLRAGHVAPIIRRPDAS